MKLTLLLIFALLNSSVLIAQSEHGQVVQRSTRKLTADEVKNLYSTNITDPNFYDLKGNLVDSADAKAKLESLDYQQGWMTLRGERRKIISKIDSASQMRMYSEFGASFTPKSDKLKNGNILDLKPFGKRIDRDRFRGKAVLLIFWCDGCYNGKTTNDYAAVNAALSKYINPEKLQVLTITHHTVEHAMKALARNPIVNTQHIVEAGDIARAYETDGRPVLVLTDKDHKIIYSVTGAPVMTPWMLKTRLKEL